MIIYDRSETFWLFLGDNPFVCPYESCPSAFKTSSDLKRHARMHTGEKPFACEFCDYKCAIKCESFIPYQQFKPFSYEFCDYKCAIKCLYILEIKVSKHKL